MSLHPYPAEWSWWASFDGGEMFSIGPCDTREQAIREAVADGCGEYPDNDEDWRTTFIVAECKPHRADLALWFNAERWLDFAREAMDENGCGSDEDGERHPLDEISDADMADLQASVHSAIRHWQERKGYRLQSFWFAGVRNRETVDIPLTGSREEAAIEAIREGVIG